MKQDMLNILLELQNGKIDAIIAQEQISNLFKKPMFDEENMNKLAENYAKLFSTDETNYSIAYTCYRRGFQRVLKLINE